MAVTSTILKYAAVDGEMTPDARRYNATYIVHVDDQLQGPLSISLHAAVPQYYSNGSESDLFARIVSLTPKRINLKTWELSVRYSTLPYDQASRKADQDQPLNPLAAMVRRRSTTGYLELFPPKDKDGKVFANSAGQWLDGGVAVREPYIIRSYVRNEAFFNETTAKNCLWAVNSAPVFGGAAGFVICAKFDGSEVMYHAPSKVEYVEVSYEFWIRSDLFGWEERRIDAGAYWLDAESGGARKIHLPTDADNNKLVFNGTVFLDGSGNPLTPAQVAAGNVNTLVFNNHASADFRLLGLQ